MGLYDCLTCEDERFVCSEGHSMWQEEFQTKDLGCTMGDAAIDCDGAFVFRPHGWGDPEVGTMIEVYSDCRQCPAFVQRGTGNLCAAWVEFEVELADIERVNNGEIYRARVANVRRTSQPTAEWLATARLKPYMHDAAGPMPWREAQAAHMDHCAKLAATPVTPCRKPAGDCPCAKCEAARGLAFAVSEMERTGKGYPPAELNDEDDEDLLPDGEAR